MAQPKRVLIGQIFQEAHGFTPLRTPLEAFSIETGSDLVERNAGADSVLGGIIRVAQREGWTLVPTIAARASPGGRVADAAYAFIKRAVLEAVERGGFDAIALCLHGCMQTESLDSAEADLLESIRRVVGSGIPVVAGFDLHAHASGGMLEHLDFASAYKTNPHADAGSTGERVGAALSEILATGIRPVGAVAAVPMLTSGNDETSSGPLRRLHEMASARMAADPCLVDVSIFNVNPFVDGERVGQTVLVYARGNAAWLAASALAEELAGELWASRADFRHQLPTVAETLQAASDKLVLGDFGDRVLAGGPGDSVYLIEELRRLAPGRRVVAPLTDAVAVDACVSAGLGASITLQLGGRWTPGGQSTTRTGTVRALGDGSYRNRGAFMRGASFRIGPYSVFETPGLSLLITKDPLMSQDPGCFLDAGIDLDDADFIVAKSGYHFKLAFESIGTCVCLATPGLTTYEPAPINFVRARPLYPLDDFPFTARATQVGLGSAATAQRN